MLDRSAAQPRRRQPIFNVPAPVAAVLVALAGVHLLRLAIPERWDDALFARLAFVPGRISFALAPDRVVGAVVDLAARGGEGYRQAQAARYFLGDGTAQPWTLLTYALLHADGAHLFLNGIWLLAFGTPVARRFGAARFFAFLAATAVAGALAHLAAYPLDLAPVIGASAAVSGCMGAALRFMFQPHRPVAGETEEGGAARLQPAQPLSAVLTDRRALIFLVAWFATNLLFGIGSVALGATSSPVAWVAHIGGFAAGLLLFRLFDPRPAYRPGPPDEAAPSAPEEPAQGL